MKKTDKVSIWKRTEGKIVPTIYRISMVIIIICVIYNFYTGKFSF